MNLMGAVSLAVFLKEFKEALRSLSGTLVLTVGACVVIQYFPLQTLVDSGLPVEILNLQAGTAMMYLIVMAILFAGQILVAKFFFEEKQTGVLSVLLASGVAPRALWLGKMVAVFVLCALVAGVSCVGYFILASVIFHLTPTFTLFSGVFVFVTFPALSFGLVALIAFTYWLFKRMGAFNMIFPMVALMGLWYLSSVLAGVEVPGYLAVISLGGGFLAITLSWWLVGCLSNERIIAT